MCYQDDTSSCYGFSADLQETKIGGNSVETCGFIIQIREKNDQIIIIVNPQLYKVELLKIRTKKNRTSIETAAYRILKTNSALRLNIFFLNRASFHLIGAE